MGHTDGLGACAWPDKRGQAALYWVATHHTGIHTATTRPKIEKRKRHRHEHHCGVGQGGFGMMPWCVVLVCSWRRLLADCHSLPFPCTLSLHRWWCPSASHHPGTLGQGGWHDTRVCCCLQLAAPIGLSPLTGALPLNPFPPQAGAPIGLAPLCALPLPAWPVLTSLHRAQRRGGTGDHRGTQHRHNA